MPKLFLGRGLGFPIKLNKGNLDVANLDVAEYEDSVRQSIVIILGTAKGERVMRPDFGCGIYDLVFEVKTAATAGRVSQSVQEALLLFEPRIDVLDVEVVSRLDEVGEMLLINVTYEVRATNNVFNLVYPFYLERSASL
ncbi:MAG: GPW/gp25 family protein [Stenomitos frigidus ULC029]